MCRVHTERFHWLCAHSFWLTTCEENGSCRGCREQHAYRLQVCYNFICPSCRGPYPSIHEPQDDGLPIESRTGEDRRLLEEYKGRMYRPGHEAEVERMSLKRRVQAYDDAYGLYHRAYNACTGPAIHEPDPKLVGVLTARVPPRCLPLQLLPNNYLTDSTEFSSPNIMVVPPGLIPRDLDKCGVCWGSLVGISDAACEGGPPRMLPCGHIYGKKCISKVFERISSCPHCTRRYIVRRQGKQRTDPVNAVIDGLMEDPRLEPEWLFARNIVMRILTPFVLAVVLTMDVGPKVGMNRGEALIGRRVKLPVKIVVWAACIALSQAIYGYFLWVYWTGRI
ncbi:hypothetical protein F5882DRAFT_523476 [Hyaloscypha sp. PMI_1271]|nr:hypothetical protein F5882DRAFT_523476 [Hyaloscypha sp. PMI_1271]